MNCVLIDLLPTQGPLLPTPWAGEIRLSLLHFGTFIHGFVLRNVFTHELSVTSYTSVNIYNLNSRLTHFNAHWMEYIRSLRTGIMAEYPVCPLHRDTYIRIEQTSKATKSNIRNVQSGGARGLELRTSELSNPHTFNLTIIYIDR